MDMIDDDGNIFVVPDDMDPDKVKLCVAEGELYDAGIAYFVVQDDKVAIVHTDGKVLRESDATTDDTKAAVQKLIAFGQSRHVTARH